MYIYKITFPNGKIYVGQCCRTPENSIKYCGSGGIHFKNAIKKYGIKNVKKEILRRDIKDQFHLDLWEEIYIRKFKSNIVKFGYNKALGNPMGAKGTKNPMSRPEIRSIIGQKTRGRKVSEQTKQKMSKAGKGRKQDSEWIRKRTEKMTETFKDPEIRTNISLRTKGVIRSIETRKKMSESAKGRKPWNKGKKLVGKEGYSAGGKSNDGRKHTIETRNKVSKSLLGNQRTKGMQWVNDGMQNKMILNNQSIPKGFKKGMLKRN